MSSAVKGPSPVSKKTQQDRILRLVRSKFDPDGSKGVAPTVRELREMSKGTGRWGETRGAFPSVPTIAAVFSDGSETDAESVVPFLEAYSDRYLNGKPVLPEKWTRESVLEAVHTMMLDFGFQQRSPQVMDLNRGRELGYPLPHKTTIARLFSPGDQRSQTMRGFVDAYEKEYGTSSTLRSAKLREHFAKVPPGVPISDAGPEASVALEI